jgi:hypothetical protein
MIEKLIENWLINVHELGYQIPFCEVLLTEKYSVLHVSRHGRGEHGKDIIARDRKGRLFAYQLKQGDITLNDWRSIRGEVEELVRLPVSTTLPTLTTGESHLPVLVTNGELRGDAAASIQSFAEQWERDGAQRLQVIQKHELLKQFIEAHGNYLPTDLRDFRKFVELYISDPHDRLPKKDFADFLTKLISPAMASGRGKKTKRAIESMVLIGSYVIEAYERANNHVAAAEAWTIIASNIFQICERELLSARSYEQSLKLVWLGLSRNLQDLRTELLERKHFVESSFILGETDFIRGVRTLITLGWIAADSLIREQTVGTDVSKLEVLRLVKQVLRTLAVTGEADWPAIVCLSLFLEKGLGSSFGEGLLESWVRTIIVLNRNQDDDNAGIPPPYWSQEKVLSSRYGLLPPYKKERFAGHSYTIQSALDMLVRRLCRQFVSTNWKSASRLSFCDYIPDVKSDWFAWRTEKGDLRMNISQQPASWSKWRSDTAEVSAQSIPAVLLRHPHWILPFVLTYPHRLNRSMSAVIDSVVGDRVSINTGLGENQP